MVIYLDQYRGRKGGAARAVGNGAYGEAVFTADWNPAALALLTVTAPHATRGTGSGDPVITDAGALLENVYALATQI